MIELRAPLPSDVEALHPLVAGTGVADTLLWDGPASLDEYRRTWLIFVEEVARGGRQTFTIVETATGAVIGTAGLRPVAGSDAAPWFRADIGLFIGIPYQGRGYGTAAVRQLLDVGFGKLGLEKIEAAVFVGNVASRRIFEKNGFVLEGTIRKAVRKRGRLVDEWLLGIVREERVSA
ncbi:MAG: acetyltransferase, family [Myxococcales bacterium]|nr:acetyltransferase, family [Myxococcales bacterium]